MFKRLVTKVFGTRFQRELKRIQPLVDAIHRHEARLQGLSDAELRAQTPKFRAVIAERTGALAAEVERLRQAKHDCADAEERLQLSDQLAKAEHALAKELQGALDGLLAEAFATVREACRRLTGSKLVVTAHELTWDMVPYDVQLIGGIVLHQGRIAEMATGEGKTLVATLPLYLNALAGRGAHLVTVNNYLARRDSQWMGHLFKWLGLTVGCIDDTQPGSPERRATYQCDITYGTKNEKLLKLLNEQGVKQQVQRVELDRLADRKLPARDQKMRHIEDDLYFVMDERGRSVHLTDQGVETMSPQDPALFVVPDISHAIHEVDHDPDLSPAEKIERRRAVEAEYAAKSETLHIIHKLLQAHALYEKDVEYVVQDAQVFIVDEFTGRLMHGRRWSDGLHQAVEAKEGVKVREESQTLATITIQNYFRMYEKLAGMTGTAETEETEFHQIYKLEVVVIPTNRPVRRVDKHDLVYKTRKEKYDAIMEEIERQHKRGLPILVGTTNVEASETLSRF